MMGDTEAIRTFGAWLKSRRRSLDLTQEALADRAACSVEMVRKVEAGSARPSRQLAELLVSSVGVPADEIPPLVEWARLGRRGGSAAPATRADARSADNFPPRVARVSVLTAAIALVAAGALVVTAAVFLDLRRWVSPTASSLDVPGGISNGSPVAASTEAMASVGVQNAPTPDPLHVQRPIPITPGRYRLTLFRPELEFTIPEDGWMLAAQSTDAFELGRYGASTTPDAYIGGAQVQVVFDYPCRDAPARTLEERPRALIDWLQGNVYISTANLRPVSFAGFTGLSIDISYAKGPPEECPPLESEGDRTRIHLFAVGDVTFMLEPGERARIISADVEGRPLTILVGTYDSEHYDDFEEIAQPILESIAVNP